jgi:Rrf2 family protein
LPAIRDDAKFVATEKVMKFSSQEEYGLRCLLRIAREHKGASLTIPEISEGEGISTFYVAKLMRILRRAGLVRSARGKIGGYTLARPPDQISVSEALAALGGRLFESDFCTDHPGAEPTCARLVDCSIRSLWRAVQNAVDRVLSKTTLTDMLRNEQEMASLVSPLIQISPGRAEPPEATAPTPSETGRSDPSH